MHLGDNDLMRLVPTEHAARHRWMALILRASIAYQIRTGRLMRGWKQEELAHRAGLSVTTISRLEDVAGEDPTLSTLQAIAHAFDCALIVRFESWPDFVRQMSELIPPNEFSADDLTAKDSPDALP